MRGRTAARGLTVLLGGGTLIVLSQLLAAPPGEQSTQLDATRATTTTTAVVAVTSSTSSTTTTEALPPITGPVRLDERSKFDGRGVGPIEAGMTVAEAEQAAGRRFTVQRDDPGAACYTATIDGLPGLEVAVKGPSPVARDGAIVRIAATDSAWSTVSGVRVGASKSEVQQAYGTRAKASPDASMLTVSVKDAGQSYAVVFVMSQRDTVTAIRSGEAAAATAPEGCG
jgi:hypothetical protein